ncbi:hypothetical protein AWJ20_4849 [Sugiyamaella lignohabitans]|uniref:Uncharacterized protein n=1 Tax=Sugiyamaella lignohabitans TaxID=796027 RepID=A0A167ECA2_9ASCO|nr:uncharacterized protein AWJ20_4849 [Sugiyamaella lignohabitans]ANB13898.1 hypothetical protein AWJ20_4849 [Sugiyamaella lignohabitans]
MVKQPYRGVRPRPLKLNRIGRSAFDDIHLLGGIGHKWRIGGDSGNPVNSGSKSGYSSDPESESSRSSWPYFNRSLFKVSSPTAALNMIPKWMKAVKLSVPSSSRAYGWWHTSNWHPLLNHKPHASHSMPDPIFESVWSCKKPQVTYHEFKYHPRTGGKGRSAIWLKYNISNESSLRNLREEEERYQKEQESTSNETDYDAIDLISLKKKVRTDESQNAAYSVEPVDTINASETPLSTRGGGSRKAEMASGESSKSGGGLGSGDNSGGDGRGKKQPPPVTLQSDPTAQLSKKQRKRARAAAAAAQASNNFTAKDIDETLEASTDELYQTGADVESKPLSQLRKPIQVPTESMEQPEVSSWSSESVPVEPLANETVNNGVETDALSSDSINPITSSTVSDPLHDNSSASDRLSTGQVYDSTTLSESESNESPEISSKVDEDETSHVSTNGTTGFPLHTASVDATENITLPTEPVSPVEHKSESTGGFDLHANAYPVDNEKNIHDTFSPLSGPDSQPSGPHRIDTVTAGDLLEGLQLKGKYKDSTKDFERLLSLVETEKHDSEKRKSFTNPVRITREGESPSDVENLFNEPKPISTFAPPLEMQDIHHLQDALKEAKADEEKHAQEMFRIENAMDYTKSVSSKRPRSIESGNFFTPVNRTIASATHRKPGAAYEYIIVTPNQKFIRTRTLPFKDDNPRRDLFSALSEMSDPALYVKTIAKLEKANWKCIGGGGPGRLLVFEREYNPIKRFSKLLLKLTGSFLGLVSLAAAVAVMIESPF